MICKGLLTDRKKLVEAVEKATGQKAGYCGAPTFKYTIGAHAVLRDGSLETEDRELVKRLAQEGLLEGEQRGGGISFPVEGMTGRGLTNIVNSVAAREKMLNKAVGRPNAFHISVCLLRSLKEENPAAVSDFMDVMYIQGGEKAVRGIRIGRESISFPGFPDTETFQALARLMVETAKEAVWIKPKAKETENEKYSFRVWLVAIGMKGPEYKAARKELIARFEGDTAFRTQEQRLAWEQKKKKPVKTEPDFIIL